MSYRRVDLRELASRLANKDFYASCLAVDVDEDSDDAAEEIVQAAERAGGGSIKVNKAWEEAATIPDRADLREFVVEEVAELIRSMRTAKR